MSHFTEAALRFLRSVNSPAQCSHCGNPNLDELAITGLGRVVCRMDIPEISNACSNSQTGWRVLGPTGEIVSSGTGITMKVDGGYGCS